MISDFRDPWTQGQLETKRPFPFKNIEILLEKMVIHRSSKVISVTEEIKKDFIRRYGSKYKDKFIVVTNGFDWEEIQSAHPHNYDHYTILYAGRDYDGHGNIRLFLDKIKNIRLPHHLVLSHMKGATALYLNQLDEPIPPLTTKIFEYMGVQHPIIANTKKNSEMDQIIKNTNSGFTFDVDKDYKLEEFLRQEYEEYRTSKNPRHLDNEDLIIEYDRKRLAAKVASVIRNVAEPKYAKTPN
jgi:glycosyltransferase involved in cell wall biosynthesis